MTQQQVKSWSIFCKSERLLFTQKVTQKKKDCNWNCKERWERRQPTPYADAHQHELHKSWTSNHLYGSSLACQTVLYNWAESFLLISQRIYTGPIFGTLEQRTDRVSKNVDRSRKEEPESSKQEERRKEKSQHWMRRVHLSFDRQFCYRNLITQGAYCVDSCSHSAPKQLELPRTALSLARVFVPSYPLHS